MHSVQLTLPSASSLSPSLSFPVLSFPLFQSVLFCLLTPCYCNTYVHSIIIHFHSLLHKIFTCLAFSKVMPGNIDFSFFSCFVQSIFHPVLASPSFSILNLEKPFEILLRLREEWEWHSEWSTEWIRNKGKEGVQSAKRGKDRILFGTRIHLY